MPTLYTERLTGAVAPARWLLMTHGIYGAGGNWRGIARKLQAKQPDLGVVLLDLRLHGRSPDGSPPHTVAACAADVAETLAELARDGVRVASVSGHSFGGKVMLALRQRGDHAFAHTWVLDSTPSARPDEWDNPHNSVLVVMRELRRLPRHLPSRKAFVEALTAADVAPSIAQWLALSLVPDGDGVRLRFDLDAVAALIDDYLDVDLWSAVTDPALAGEVHLVVATRSRVVSAADRARLATFGPPVHTHEVDAGHWLHVDAPDAVVELLART